MLKRSTVRVYSEEDEELYLDRLEQLKDDAEWSMSRYDQLSKEDRDEEKYCY